MEEERLAQTEAVTEAAPEEELHKVEAVEAVEAAALQFSGNS